MTDRESVARELERAMHEVWTQAGSPPRHEIEALAEELALETLRSGGEEPYAYAVEWLGDEWLVGVRCLHLERDNAEKFAAGIPQETRIVELCRTPSTETDAPGEGEDRDGCEVCGGERRGVPGNENLVDGVKMCDYCHADHISDSGEGEGWLDKWMDDIADKIQAGRNVLTVILSKTIRDEAARRLRSRPGPTEGPCPEYIDDGSDQCRRCGYHREAHGPETDAPGEGENRKAGVKDAEDLQVALQKVAQLGIDPDEGSGEGEEMRWTDEDEAELRDYQARVSCSGRYDQYEPTRHDHSRLAELKERKERATKAWVRRVEEYQSLSDSALEQVARYRAEQGGVNPDTAALLVLLCERWSRLRSRPEPTVEGEEEAHPYDVLYAAVWRCRNLLSNRREGDAAVQREYKRLNELLDEHAPHWHDWAHHKGESSRLRSRPEPTVEGLELLRDQLMAVHDQGEESPEGLPHFADMATVIVTAIRHLRERPEGEDTQERTNRIIHDTRNGELPMTDYDFQWVIDHLRERPDGAEEMEKAAKAAIRTLDRMTTGNMPHHRNEVKAVLQGIVRWFQQAPDEPAQESGDSVETLQIILEAGFDPMGGVKLEDWLREQLLEGEPGEESPLSHVELHSPITVPWRSPETGELMTRKLTQEDFDALKGVTIQPEEVEDA